MSTLRCVRIKNKTIIQNAIESSNAIDIMWFKEK